MTKFGIGVLLAVVLSACTAGPPVDSGATGSPQGAMATSGTAAPTPTPLPVLMLGPSRYVSPCLLLPWSDVDRIYGQLPAQGTISEAFLDYSIPEADLRAMASTYGRGVVRTHCGYGYLDQTQHALDVQVDQYVDAPTAHDIWSLTEELGTGPHLPGCTDTSTDPICVLDAANRADDAGTPVAGLARVLFQPKHGTFLGLRGNVVITLRESLGFDKTALTKGAGLVSATARAKAAFAVIDANLARPDLPQGHLPPNWGGQQTHGTTRYIDPCRLIDTDMLRAIGGSGELRPVEATSLTRDPAGRAQIREISAKGGSASCKRGARAPVAGTNKAIVHTLDVKLNFASSPAEGQAVLENHIVQTLLSDADEQRYTVANLVAGGYLTPVPDLGDGGYFLDTPSVSSKHLYFRSGPYVIELTSVAMQDSTFTYAPLAKHREAAVALLARLPGVVAAAG